MKVRDRTTKHIYDAYWLSELHRWVVPTNDGTMAYLWTTTDFDKEFESAEGADS